MLLRGCINFFPESSDAASMVLRVLRETLKDLDVASTLLQNEPCPTHYGVSIVDDYFAAAGAPKEDFTIIIASRRIETSFGYRIAGETRDRMIVVAGPSINTQTVHRLIRHELGHVFDLPEHPDCVMWHHYIADPSYCATCVSQLKSRQVYLVGAAAPDP